MYKNKKEFNNRIAVAYGDGIGPEIMEAVLQILQAAKVNLSIDVISIGEEEYNHGISSGIPMEAWDTIKNNRILLKAPITTPQGKGYKSVNVTLRNNLDLFANIRPVISYHPFVKCNYPKMNVVILRENQEGLYTGIEYRQTKNSHKSLKIISRSGSEKIIKYAFDYAIKYNRKKVTCFIKDNIMKITDGMFHNIFNETAPFYPEIETSQMLVDIGMAKVAVDPESFDIIVTQNLYGDILSDIAAEVSGSVGLCGSANIGVDYAMFEAIHGSAPDIAGKDISNPSGLLNAAIMMLNHVSEHEKSELIMNALHATLEQGIHTADLYNTEYSTKRVGTKEYTEAIISNLGNKPKELGRANNKATATHLAARKINLQKTFPIEKKKDLVGVDIFIDNIKLWKIEKITKIIKDATQNLSLGMQAIIVRGIAVWPGKEEYLHNIPDTYSCRFVSRNNRNKRISQQDIISLLNILDQQKLHFTSSENLYIFDGKIGFSEVLNNQYETEEVSS